MRAAFFEYVQLLSRHWWQLLIGGVAGVVGIAHDMGATWLEEVPTWVWYAIAILTFVVAQFWSFTTLHKEVASRRADSKHDVSLYVVFDYVYKRIIRDDSVGDAIKVATNRILERAVKGEIQIFGTTTNPDEGDGVMVPIDKNFWRDHSFFLNELHYFKLSPIDKAKRLRTTGEGEVYYNLMTDLSQVFLCWPRTKRFVLQWPMRREVS